MADYGVPINTAISTASVFENDTIAKAQKYMLKNFSSKYSAFQPHITYSITPLPEINLIKARSELERFIKDLNAPIKIHISNLSYSERSRLFMLDIDGDNIRELHEQMIQLVEPYRENSIRAKEIDRIKANQYNQQELNNIKEYGYPRVLDNFFPHISIGTIERRIDKLSEVKQYLHKTLDRIIDTNLELNNILVNYHADSTRQNKIISLWEKKYKLKN